MTRNAFLYLFLLLPGIASAGCIDVPAGSPEACLTVEKGFDGLQVAVNGLPVGGELGVEPAYGDSKRLALSGAAEGSVYLAGSGGVAGRVEWQGVEYLVMPAGDGAGWMYRPGDSYGVVKDYGFAGSQALDFNALAERSGSKASGYGYFGYQEKAAGAAVPVNYPTIFFVAREYLETTGVDALEAIFQQLIEDANTAYSNSGTAISLSFAGIRAVATSGDQAVSDLTSFLETNSEQLKTQLMIEEAAFGVVFGLFESGDPTCGNAMGGSLFIVADDAELRCGSVYTLAHEAGHNLGLEHDPANANGEMLYDNHGYILSTGVGTVMAYGSGTVQKFSSQNYNCNGEVCGNSDSDAVAWLARRNDLYAGVMTSRSVTFDSFAATPVQGDPVAFSFTAEGLWPQDAFVAYLYRDGELVDGPAELVMNQNTFEVSGSFNKQYGTGHGEYPAGSGYTLVVESVLDSTVRGESPAFSVERTKTVVFGDDPMVTPGSDGAHVEIAGMGSTDPSQYLYFEVTGDAAIETDPLTIESSSAEYAISGLSCGSSYSVRAVAVGETTSYSNPTAFNTTPCGSSAPSVTVSPDLAGDEVVVDVSGARGESTVYLYERKPGYMGMSLVETLAVPSGSSAASVSSTGLGVPCDRSREYVAVLWDGEVARTASAGANAKSCRSGTLAFSDPSVSVEAGTYVVSFSVSRSGGTDGLAGAIWRTQDGSATALGEYFEGSGYVGFRDGAGGSKNGKVLLTLADVDSDKSFQVVLTDPVNGAALGDPMTVTITPKTSGGGDSGGGDSGGGGGSTGGGGGGGAMGWLLLMWPALLLYRRRS